MEGMNLAIFLSIAIPLSLYFLITLAGAFVKNMYNTIRGIDTTFKVYRVLTGALFSAFLMVGLENWLLTKIGLKEIVVIAFFIGILSFELFEKLSNLDSLLKYYQIYQKIKNNADVKIDDSKSVSLTDSQQAKTNVSKNINDNDDSQLDNCDSITSDSREQNKPKDQNKSEEQNNPKDKK